MFLQGGSITRNLGLDIGDRRIGVALSDTLGILATPVDIIDRLDEKQDIDIIIDLINQHGVGRVIVGLPLSLSGDAGPQAEKVKAFVEKLCACTSIPVEFRDERLTTVSAKRLMKAARTKKSGQKGGRDDAVAAAIILQGYLDESGF